MLVIFIKKWRIILANNRIKTRKYSLIKRALKAKRITWVIISIIKHRFIRIN